MRRNILLIATVLYATIGWAQTMNIHYKNGQTVQYNMNNIDYVEYTKDNPSNAQVSSEKAVDLGLSVKWANCNIGATSPEQLGDIFAWGETITKEKYKEDNYLYYDSTTDSYMDIGLDIKGTDYDAAHVKWGGSWRMPTRAEFNELMKNCQWEWVNLNGMNGYKVIGNNGNSIFIPVEKQKHYWTSDIWPSEQLKGKSDSAREIYFDNGSVSGGGLPRWHGYNIRPVMPK